MLWNFDWNLQVFVVVNQLDVFDFELHFASTSMEWIDDTGESEGGQKLQNVLFECVICKFIKYSRISAKICIIQTDWDRKYRHGICLILIIIDNVNYNMSYSWLQKTSYDNFHPSGWKIIFGVSVIIEW